MHADGQSRKLLILLLSGWTHALWLAHVPASPIGPVDAEGFHLLAVNLLAGRGFAIGWEPPFCPTAVRTPLYPLFIAALYLLFGPLPRVVPWFQWMLAILTTALVMRLGDATGGAAVAQVAGLLYACNGTTPRYTGYLLAEPLLLPLMTATLWGTVRVIRHPSARSAILTGGGWGAVLLTKPNVQYLPLFVGLLLSLAARRRRNGRAIPLLFVGALTATLAPWMARNRQLTGRWQLSTAFEVNVARVSAVATLAWLEHVDALPWTETWEYLYGQLVSTTAARYAWQGENTSCAQTQARQHQIAQVARNLIRHHPRAFVAAHLRGVLLSLLDPGHQLWYTLLTGKTWASTGVVANIWTRMAWSLERGAVGDALAAFWRERVVRIPPTAAAVWWGLLLARLTLWRYGLRGLWRLRRAPLIALALGGTVAYLLLLPGPIAYDRFYVPAIPVVVVLAAVGGMASRPGRNPPCGRSHAAPKPLP